MARTRSTHSATRSATRQSVQPLKYGLSNIHHHRTITTAEKRGFSKSKKGNKPLTVGAGAKKKKSHAVGRSRPMSRRPTRRRTAVSSVVSSRVAPDLRNEGEEDGDDEKSSDEDVDEEESSEEENAPSRRSKVKETCERKQRKVKTLHRLSKIELVKKVEDMMMKHGDEVDALKREIIKVKEKLRRYKNKKNVDVGSSSDAELEEWRQAVLEESDLSSGSSDDSGRYKPGRSPYRKVKT
ncbi:hypothetical protein NBRC10512_004679 [Rhodotorula toruloides]|uniref:Uncharacterized protein n=1 Tax=Rhodotorula toruloides (strain NP11) TaxID=1130832 RepID=M7WY34_RHOT1|nr:uncharacterized protein RHTO_07877 [Rhodotorula toruloides NP11]EMS23006.1 hypothetical protein RHTO_07877 [Rhodotorula toruloides NP11]